MEKKNNSIELLRLFFAIVVVSQHVPIYLGEQLRNHSFWYFMTRQLGRVSVPFFFVVSGYFYFKALLQGKDIMKKYLKKILLTYSVWFIIYLPINLYDLICNQKRGLFSCLFSLVGKYVIFGSYYQLWYMPILFFGIVISGLCIKNGKIKYIVWIWTVFYIVGLVIKFPLFSGTSIYSMLEGVPYYFLIDRFFLSGVPMFMLGYWVNKWEQKWINVPTKFIFIAFCIVSVVLYYFSLPMKNTAALCNLYCNIATPIWLALLLDFCLLHPMNQNDKIANYAKKTSAFLYYVHPIVLIIMSQICSNATSICFLLIPVLVSLLCCYIIIKSKNKYLMKLL